MDTWWDYWKVHPNWGLFVSSLISWILFLKLRKIRQGQPTSMSPLWLFLSFFVAVCSSILAIAELNTPWLNEETFKMAHWNIVLWVIYGSVLLVMCKLSVTLRSLESLTYETKNALIQEQLLLQSVSQTQRVLSLQEKVHDAQRLSLKSQMNPHFLFNILTGIQHLLMKQESEKASLVFNKFRKLLMLGFMSHDRVIGTIQNEIDHVNQYLDLENDRISKTLSIDWRVGVEVNKETTPCPLFILQPLVENAIWHGLADETIEKPQITIVVQWQDEDLEILVHDNGRGLSEKVSSRAESTHAKHASRGTQIVRERLQLLRHPGTFEIIENYPKHPFSSGITSKLHLPLWALEPPVLETEKRKAS